MAFYEGQRLSYDGALCTVRYLGPLKDLKGEWLGVEWDRPARGKHDGQHQGEKLFQCLSPSPTAASFIRPSRKPDPPRTLLEAIKIKYGSPSPMNGSIGPNSHNTIEISGKTVEEVGFEKVQKQISHLSDLKVVLVDGLNVRALALHPSMTPNAQAELAETCPNITELDLGWNALEDWQDVADISASLNKLRILKASGLRLRSFVAACLPDGNSPFESITELHLNESLLRPTQVIRLLSTANSNLFPSLKALWLSGNELSSFYDDSHHKFHSVTTLVLENNKFTSLDSLVNIFHHFPNLAHLSLQGNIVSSIGFELADSRFPSLASLNIADNRIASLTFVDALPTHFPSLTSLRISRNPLYDNSKISDRVSTNQTPNTTATSPHTTPALPSDSTYYLTLARIPTLLTLNHTKISTRDREEGEIYYLFVAERDIRNILASTTTSPTTPQSESLLQIATKKYPLYASLCTKYDRPNILSSPPSSSPLTQTSTPQYPPGSLGARLIDATFYIPPPSSHPQTPSSSHKHQLTRLLPPSLPVHSLKALMSRHFGLPPLQFKLIHETGELDPVDPIIETTTKLRGREGWDTWGDWDVDAPAHPKTESEGGLAVRAEEEVEEKGGDESEVLAMGREKDSVVRQVQGVRFQPRETEIKDGMRAWGDYLDLEVGKRDVTIRVEPFELDWEAGRERWRREDLRDIIERGTKEMMGGSRGGWGRNEE